MKKFRLFLIYGIAVLFMASCNTYHHSMREPNAHIEYYAGDFDLSEAVYGEATVTRVLFIDWEHTFGTEKIGSLPTMGTTIPVLGLEIVGGANYALYDMMKKNPGYDVVIYPQVESYRHAPVLGTDIYSKTTYKVTARLGKLKKK